jgi:hypothetical protein
MFDLLAVDFNSQASWSGFFTFFQFCVQEAAPAPLIRVVFDFYRVMLSINYIVGASVDFETHTILRKRSYQIPLFIFFVAPTIQLS